MALCRVKTCVAEAAPPSPLPRTVCTSGICAPHQSLPDDELAELLRRDIGLVSPLVPVTDRIEYEPLDNARRRRPSSPRTNRRCKSMESLQKRKGNSMREVPTVRWDGCYDQSWRDLIVPEAFAH